MEMISLDKKGLTSSSLSQNNLGCHIKVTSTLMHLFSKKHVTNAIARDRLRRVQILVPTHLSKPARKPSLHTANHEQPSHGLCMCS